MHVLVTGGGGFLGTYIVKALLRNNHFVSSLSRHHYPHLTELDVHQIQCDLSNADDLQKIDLSTYDAVIHTAALAGVWGDSKTYEKINYLGTINLVKKAKESGVKYFIYTSSPSVVFGKDDLAHADESTSYPGKYLTDYARTKAMAEKEILAASDDNFQAIALRPHLIWGPGDPHLIPRILEKAKAGKLKQVGSGGNMVDIIYVENAAMAHVQALTVLAAGKKLGGNAYFIGQDEPVVLWDFIGKILELNNIEPVEDVISFKSAYFIGAVLEKVYKFLGILKPEPPMTRFVAMQLAKNHYFSHAKAKRDFAYNPKISTEEGLEITFAKEKLELGS